MCSSDIWYFACKCTRVPVAATRNQDLLLCLYFYRDPSNSLHTELQSVKTSPVITLFISFSYCDDALKCALIPKLRPLLHLIFFSYLVSAIERHVLICSFLEPIKYRFCFINTCSSLEKQGFAWNMIRHWLKEPSPWHPLWSYRLSLIHLWAYTIDVLAVSCWVGLINIMLDWRLILYYLIMCGGFSISR